MMTTSYFLDNNIYRHLTTSVDGAALRQFNISIRDAGIIPTTDVKIRMTPFTIIEAIGLNKIPQPNIKLNAELKRKSPLEIFDFLLGEAKSFYTNTPTLKRDHFISLANNQSKYTSQDTNAKELEQRCIYKPLSFSGFEKYFIDALTFDYVFKYRFSKDIEFDIMNKFFVPSIFIETPFTSGLSKFRLAKRFWDSMYQKMLLENFDKHEIVQNINTSMKLKEVKYFVDCDLIHKVTIGDNVNESYRSSVAFTCDDEQSIVNRIMVYKTFIEYLITQLEENARETYTKSIRNWQQGILVFCNTDGTFKSIIEVKEIQSFQ